jgi:hypothetical protein
MSIECTGNTIRCHLDGKEAIPTLTDSSFTAGKIGFWTKSDSVTYFGDTKLVYTPRERMAQVVVRDMLHKYPRLVGIQVFAKGVDGSGLKVIASNREDEIGTMGESPERDVITRDVIYFGKEKKNALVTMPLHDRNGDTVAAVRVIMQSFKGQTEENAVARALPIVKEIEARLRPSKTILD